MFGGTGREGNIQEVALGGEGMLVGDNYHDNDGGCYADEDNYGRGDDEGQRQLTFKNSLIIYF